MQLEVRNIAELEALFETAARIESRLPDREKKMLYTRCGWPEYLYDADDKKDHEEFPVRLALSARDMLLMDVVMGWLAYVGRRNDQRVMRGRKAVWMRAQGFVFEEIGRAIGMSHMSAKRYYDSAIGAILKKVQSC